MWGADGVLVDECEVLVECGVLVDECGVLVDECGVRMECWLMSVGCGVRGGE